MGPVEGRKILDPFIRLNNIFDLYFWVPRPPLGGVPAATPPGFNKKPGSRAVVVALH